MEIKSVIKYKIYSSTTCLPVRQKISDRVLYTSRCRGRAFESLPWRAQLVAFTIGTAFLSGFAKNTLDKYVRLTGNFVLKRDAILNLLEYFFFKHHEHKNHYHNHESYHQYFHPSFYLRMKHPFSKMC